MSAKVIMIQGTMSNSGKTFLTAGLCRVFAQDGYKVAPFKSQNMALNSYITEDGLEIGRAQAMQAEAAGIKPTVAMNPILLKPTSTMGSQVIVGGEVYGNLSAMDYFKRKTDFIPNILEAFHELQEQYDIIVIEGAGSPAEINLKSQDIVNMGLAKMVDAPVLLVADIDRGGVFASLYGTLALLEEEERERVVGMVINKFRGDPKILESGIEMIEQLTKKRVLGLIPMEEIQLDDEDSLSERICVKKAQQNGKDVAIIRFPHISNFTDFMALEWYKGLSVRYVERKEELGNPDFILLPGSKNTMNDLKWLRESGLEGAILRQSTRAKIFGICGGFQMLGKQLYDPDGMEYGGTMRGMGLLDMETIFQGQKTRTRMEATLCHWKENPTISGYEIHMGTTVYGQEVSGFSVLENGRLDGAMNESGTVVGTYLHGIFDNELFAKAYFGIEEVVEEGDFWKFKQSQYDKLANLIRDSINMKEIYRILFEKEEEEKKEIGLIHLYCGNGKGKTTAGVGLALRMAGAGKKAMIYQFMKNNSTSERSPFVKVCGLTWIEGEQQVKFSSQMTEEEKKEALEKNNRTLKQLFEQAKTYDLLMLDEVIYAIGANLVDEKLLLKCLKEKPKNLEVVLTGQNPSQQLVEIADYVTEMKKVKHPYEKGIVARKGIEL